METLSTKRQKKGKKKKKTKEGKEMKGRKEGGRERGRKGGRESRVTETAWYWFRNTHRCQAWWFTPIISALWEAETG